MLNFFIMYCTCILNLSNIPIFYTLYLRIYIFYTLGLRSLIIIILICFSVLKYYTCVSNLILFIYMVCLRFYTVGLRSLINILSIFFLHLRNYGFLNLFQFFLFLQKHPLSIFLVQFQLRLTSFKFI